MSPSSDFPQTAKSLVQFSSSKTGEISLTDQVSAQGTELTLGGQKNNLDFMVEYQGYWFAIHVDQQGTKTFLHIHGAIGKLPYSFESAFARTNIMAVVRAASRALGGSVQIDEAQNIILIDTIKFEGGISPKVVLAETTKVLLRVKPYLMLVTELQPPQTSTLKAPQNYKKQPESSVEFTEATQQQPAPTLTTPKKRAPKTFRVKLKPNIKTAPK
ncbi:hypothetical protein [Terasakiella sp. SH-1]|uniref:hypothetical protein n=1 Tax=Terasakiella sp. SH-1 TaxID=2560057 RepID=UPI001074663A|nr:hypothetical protein [Terasakiella sp. SH-1]